MAGPKVFDRVKETCSAPGTGTVSLLGAATGFRAFTSVLSNGDTCFYCIADQSGSGWEVGVGTFTTSGATLARTTVLASSNGGAAVNFSAGTQDVFIGPAVGQFDRLWHPTDQFANLAAFQAGRVLFPSDGFCLYRDSGSALVPWGPVFPLTDPTLQSFSWVNQGTSTVTTTNGGIVLDAASSGLVIRGRVKSQPAKPYKVDACFLTAPETGQWLGGLMWRDSVSGKCATFGWDTSYPFAPRSDKWSDANTLAASYTNGNLYYPIPRLIWLRIQDDNTSRKCWVSGDGQNWGANPVHSVGNTDYLTADQVGFFATSRPSVNTRVTLLSWKES